MGVFLGGGSGKFGTGVSGKVKDPVDEHPGFGAVGISC